MLQVEGLSKYYGSIKSVDNISFKLQANEVVGLLGENGAGKSTTMNMLTGCLPPSKGIILFDGIDTAENQAEYKSRIGYLPEVPPLYLDMTVAEELSFVCGVKRIQGRERMAEIDRVCELTNISHMRNRLTGNLSKGYKQRVGLAQALLGDPAFLVLDEPMAGLDPRQITEMRELITSLELTVIISSHILSEISAMCTRLLVLKQGRLLADAMTADFAGLSGTADTLHFKVRDTVEIDPVLSGHTWIKQWQEIESRETGCREFTVVAAAGQDIREDLFMVFAREKIPVLHFELRKPTLEDIFIELTR